MQKIINVVKDYLTRETNNALLITGKWGVGKTFFFNNILSKEIVKTSIKGDASSTYTFIRVSLFGVTNIDDIERRTIAALSPLLNTLKKWGEKTLTFLSSIPKIKEYIPDELINRLKNTDSNSDIIISKANTLVICFDDLERISKSFAIENLIGYINNLTENYDFKVILIGNTDKIKRKIFKKIKEKLIGVEIEFDNNIKSIFDDIVKKKFHEDESNRNTYEKFLEKEKDFICSFFSKDYKNIRTLLIVLECYKHIYSAIIGLNSKPLKKYREDLIKSTFLFTIAIAIEFKKGNLSKKDKEIINNEIQTILNFTNNQEEDLFAEPQENEEINPNILKKKYYEQYNYKYYETIFDYIIGINTFIEEKFIAEAKQKYGISQNENLPECYKALNEISTDVIFEISNEEYNSRLTKVLQYVDNGEYELDSYVYIYNHIIKYEDPLKIGKEKLKKHIIAGIKKGKDNLKYNQELTQMSQHLHFPNSMDEYAREILQFCLSINEEKKQEIHKKVSTNLENLLAQNNFEKFKKIAIENTTVPIFLYIDSKVIFDYYNNNIPLRKDIANFIKERVITNGPLAVLKLEKNFYEQLQQSIEKKANQLKSGPEWFLYSEFNNVLKSIIKNL
ncbi:P-loop NTPase fold protein [Capnocytophaga leadbetteri]|uniref:P-loop NTPase fold protein n=1 Tax=Capnocytophaga leadbetteri TaxID=327575 RepID=UPI0028E23F5C|nr:P-loop NTPase fold protein [Capnocytophaga leadbetteri]